MDVCRQYRTIVVFKTIIRIVFAYKLNGETFVSVRIIHFFVDSDMTGYVVLAKYYLSGRTAFSGRNYAGGGGGGRVIIFETIDLNAPGNNNRGPDLTRRSPGRGARRCGRDDGPGGATTRTDIITPGPPRHR